MKKLIFIIMTSFVFMILSSAQAADVPRLLNYQGYVEDSGGVPIDGPGYFKFAIVNEAGDTSYWSNDGTSTIGDEPSNWVVIPVSDGFFTLKLGDTNITNMGVLDTTPFDQQNIYVRVWFSDSGAAFQLLTPDTQIASAG
ncbi:MAG: galactose oxidase, partial [Deltaproteobacteria bacterium]